MPEIICNQCKTVIEDNVFDMTSPGVFIHGDPIDCFHGYENRIAELEQKLNQVKEEYGMEEVL